jgi:hypothetical protein
MKRIYVSCAVIFAAAFSLIMVASLVAGEAVSQSRSHPVSIAAVQKFKPPLTLMEVEKAFGPATGQPGPCVTYPSADQKGMSLWFWYWRPQASGSISKEDVHIEFIILATTTKEEKQQVVWPPRSVNVSPAQLIRDISERYGRAAKSATGQSSARE